MRVTDKDFLTPPEAAKFLGVSPGTLRVWRVNNKHKIPFIKFGNNIRYKTSELHDFLNSKMVEVEGV